MQSKLIVIDKRKIQNCYFKFLVILIVKMQIAWFLHKLLSVYFSYFRRGIMPSSSRLIKPGRAGSMAPSELGQDSLQDESSLDGEENSEK